MAATEHRLRRMAAPMPPDRRGASLPVLLGRRLQLLWNPVPRRMTASATSTRPSPLAGQQARAGGGLASRRRTLGGDP
jgi:hypothetical protein